MRMNYEWNLLVIVGMVMLGIPTVQAGKPVKNWICIFVLDSLIWQEEENCLLK